MSPQEPDAIPVLTFSTAALPPEKRYAAWLNRDWPRSNEIYRTEPTEPFDTYWETAQLGPMLFVYTEITGMRWERRRQAIRESDFDPIIVNMMIEGSAEGDFDGHEFRETAGSFHFHDLARPSLHVSSASKTYSVVLPRPIAEEWLESLDGLHGLVVQPPAADMLLSQAREVHRSLRRLTHASAERLGRIFLELLAIAVSEYLPRQSARAPAVKLRAQAEEVIEQRCCTERITSHQLCNLLGVSREALFEAFRDDGGLRKYLVRYRLERARAALGDVERAEPISDIAFRLGFADASHLSRAFRARYGMTPRDYRRLIVTNIPVQEATGVQPKF